MIISSHNHAIPADIPNGPCLWQGNNFLKGKQKPTNSIQTVDIPAISIPLPYPNYPNYPNHPIAFYFTLLHHHIISGTAPPCKASLWVQPLARASEKHKKHRELSSNAGYPNSWMDGLFPGKSGQNDSKWMIYDDLDELVVPFPHFTK